MNGMLSNHAFYSLLAAIAISLIIVFIWEVIK